MTRRIVVTGAASGIGAATAARIEADGDKVIRCDLHDADVIADLSTPEGRRELVARVEEFGEINGVIANAHGGQDVEVNYFGTLATLEGLRPLLAKAHEPRAVAVSSFASIGLWDDALVELCLAGDESAAVARKVELLPVDPTNSDLGRFNIVYSSAKRAMNRWVRRVAATPEWAGAGIPLNVAAPGMIDTPAAAFIMNNPDLRAAVEKSLPQPLGGVPAPVEKMAAILAWLAGPDNSLMTGQILFVDGGGEVLRRGEKTW